MIARNVTAGGLEAGLVAKQLGEKLVASDLALVVVFADWRLDAGVVARDLQRILGAVPIVGCTANGVLGGVLGDGETVALGLYGTDLRVGIGVATELSKHALARSRDALERAAIALGTRSELLDPARHVAFTLVEGSASTEESFCVGSATAAPQIRMVGGFASTELSADGSRRGAAAVWANGEALADAGIVVVLEMARPFEVITSSHLVATEHKTVVTAASGRTISELDGIPATRRFTELIAKLGGTIGTNTPLAYTFARIIDGVPYVRSIGRIEGDLLHLGAAIDTGHVLRVMKAGDLVAQTERDLAAAAKRLGGISALLAFSCVYRDWEAKELGIAAALAAVYAAYPTTGFQSFGEQSGMLYVNHTLTALAIGSGSGG
ncbi:MAG: FIST N-terminal domain-containing protein [Kofleriaceae bacterium]